MMYGTDGLLSSYKLLRTKPLKLYVRQSIRIDDGTSIPLVQPTVLSYLVNNVPTVVGPGA